MKTLDPKFIMLHIRAENGIHVYEFANASDGKVIGAVVGRTVVQEELRTTYIDQEHAIKAMKDHCRGMAGRVDVEFEVREDSAPVSLTVPRNVRH